MIFYYKSLDFFLLDSYIFVIIIYIYINNSFKVYKNKKTIKFNLIIFTLQLLMIYICDDYEQVLKLNE